MGFNVSGQDTPKPIKTPKPLYTPIVAGNAKYSRIGRAPNITVINYVDSTNSRGWANDAWAKLDQNKSNGDSFWDKVNGATEIVGAVTAGISTILSSLGLGGAKESSEADDKAKDTEKKDKTTVTPEEGDNKVSSRAKTNGSEGKSKVSEAENEDEVEDEVAAEQETSEAPETKAKDNPKLRAKETSDINLGDDADKINVLEDGEELDDNSGINWDGNATVRDQESTTKTRDIKGKMKVGDRTAGKYPKTFTISDSSGEYTFKIVGTDKATGKPVYQCTSGPNGASYSKGNNYVLKDMQNGEPTLEQPSNYVGSGESLKKSNEA